MTGTRMLVTEVYSAVAKETGRVLNTEDKARRQESQILPSVSMSVFSMSFFSESVLKITELFLKVMHYHLGHS